MVYTQACFKGTKPQDQLSEEGKWGLIGAFGITLPILLIIGFYIWYKQIDILYLICSCDCCRRGRNRPANQEAEQGAVVVPVVEQQRRRMAIERLSEVARADAESDNVSNLLKDEIIALRERDGEHPFELQEWAKSNYKMELYNWIRFLTPETIKQHQRERFGVHASSNSGGV